MLNHIRGSRILVTGGSGFLGQHLVPRLVAGGASVSVLSRSPESASKLLPTASIIPGDCGDENVVAAAVKGHDIVIHLAARLFAGSWQAYLQANGAYARNLASAILNEPSVKRVLLVSSLAAAGPSATAPGRGESDPPEPVSAYGWSKLLAERTLSASLGKRLVILRPPIIYGSGDKGLLPLFKSCARGIGISPGVREFPVSIVHVSDAANAVILATGPQAAGTYHLNDGASHTMAEVCKAMGTALGKKRIVILHPPLPLMGLTAGVASIAFKIWQMSGKMTAASRPPAWNWDKFLESRQAGWLADGSKIVSELGYAPEHDLDSGMTEAVSGYRARGWL